MGSLQGSAAKCLSLKGYSTAILVKLKTLRVTHTSSFESACEPAARFLLLYQVQTSLAAHFKFVRYLTLIKSPILQSTAFGPVLCLKNRLPGLC